MFFFLSGFVVLVDFKKGRRVRIEIKKGGKKAVFVFVVVASLVSLEE